MGKGYETSSRLCFMCWRKESERMAVKSRLIILEVLRKLFICSRACDVYQKRTDLRGQKGKKIHAMLRYEMMKT